MNKITALPQKDTLQTQYMYDEYHRKYHMLDGWDTGNKQENFLMMMHIVELTGIPISGTSCLDVGCGSGDLSVFLRKRGAQKYLGIDIYEPSLSKAEEKYPTEKFILHDFLSYKLTGKYDYAFCSGSLTIKLLTNNYNFLESMVEKMWRHTKVGVVFNVLTDDDPDPDPDLFFYNREKVFTLCKEITGNKNVKIVSNDNRAQSHFYLYR